MNTDNASQNGGDPEKQDRSGLIVVLIFVFGLPLVGILAKLLGY